MAQISVAEAARRLGVGVPRIHTRIADGSLRAQRVGAQWLVDELSVMHAAERTQPGRPLSSRSAWAMIAAADQDEGALAALTSTERTRAARRLERLLALASRRPTSEGQVRTIASALRLALRNRAGRITLRASAEDLDDLRRDSRWRLTVDSDLTRIMSSDVEGYLCATDLAGLEREYLLTPTDDANVVVHVVEDDRTVVPHSRLRLAADLAEHRTPREELRAAELVYELAAERGISA